MKGQHSSIRAGVAMALALALTPLSTGCLNQCQHLCSSWYGYLNTVCGDEVDAADVNRCVADYRTVLQGSDEEQVCAVHLDFVDQLGEDDPILCGTAADGSGSETFTLPVAAPRERR